MGRSWGRRGRCQGRWAWGREKRSTIERGVAQRTKLFHPHQGLVSMEFIYIKLVSVLFLSWLATSAFLVAVLGGPLVVGRFLYIALRVPDSWIHDPFGFAVGSLIFFPIAKKCANHIYTMDAPLSNVLFAWIQRFRSPPFAKISILVATVVAWFCLAAISLGFVYELAFVKSSERFMGRKPLVENWTACWSLGFFLLNLWGYCCAAKSLDLEILVFEERAPPPTPTPPPPPPPPPPQDAEAEADERAAAWDAVGDNRLRLRCQGKHGRVASFYTSLWRVLYHWEWDRVESTVFLSQCALPVAFELGWITFDPQVCLWLCVWRFPGLSTFARLVFVRTLLGLAFAYEIVSAFQEENFGISPRRKVTWSKAYRPTKIDAKRDT